MHIPLRYAFVPAEGKAVGFDTDMVGPRGMCAGVSRTLLCGGGPPRAARRA